MSQPQKRVFISYTDLDLDDHAKAALEAVRKRGWTAVFFRDWVTGNRSVPRCMEAVDDCDALIVLVAHRYGWVPTQEQGGDSETNIVGLEVRRARDNGKEVVRLLVNDDYGWPQKHDETRGNPVVFDRLTRFKADLCEGTARRFTTPDSVRELVGDALTELEDRARKGVPAPVRPPPTDPLGAHLRRIEDTFARIPLVGFGENLQVELDIDTVYVPLRGTVRRALFVDSKHRGSRESRDKADYDLSERDVPIERAFVRAADFKLRGVAVLGEPGSGKTTCARRLVWNCARAFSDVESLGFAKGTVPFFLRLRRITKELLAPGKTLFDFLSEELRAQRIEHVEALVAAAETRPIFWCLDGLDEIADRPLRERTSAWLRELVASNPDHRFLVTCRYSGWSGDAVLGPQFVDLDVQPLSDPQDADSGQATFVRRWYRAVELALRGGGSAPSQDAADRAEELVTILAGSDFRSARMTSFAQNPLLLSIICVVHRKDRSLPRSRGALYDKCVEVMLDHWRAERRKDANLPPIDTLAARRVLEPLAWLLHDTNRREAPTSELAAAAEQTLKTLKAESGLGVDGAAFLERIRDESGVVVMPEPGTYGFLHLTFQEHLAACFAAERSAEHAQKLGALLDKKWWQEVCLLALSRGKLDFAEAWFRAALAHAEPQRDEQVFGFAVQESMHFALDSFVAALDDAMRSPEKLAFVLRALNGRKDAELVARFRKLTAHREAAVRDAARGALVAAGESPPPVPAQAKSGATALQSRVVEPSGVELVLLPAGKFKMGGRVYDEKPIHKVNVPSFWIARTPVTNAQYARYLKDRPKAAKPEYWGDRRFNSPNQPVVGISHEEAKDYCRWAGLRLPSEAEWEYACRAGTTTEYWSGDSTADLSRVGWYEGNSEKRLHDVAEKPANPWGLFDVHGNVWEWCEDRRHGSYEGAPNDGSAWTDGPSGHRVIRGGSCWGTTEYARSAYRLSRDASDRHGGVGFRPAMSVTP